MTIKEIEKESGMTRANIRYYEAEGLLDPVREKNGYREYSEEDLTILMKIKLLRSLQFSLEEIKALQSGKKELSAALGDQLAKLQREQTQLGHSQEICKAMKNDGVRYQTLDPQRYLGILEQKGEQEDWQTVFQYDTALEIRIPWRRYFARGIDLLFYIVVWNVFLALVLGENIIARSESEKLLDNIVMYLMMLLIEPIFLSLFGTTPGKWILGIRVTDNEGRRLTFWEGLSRTWKVFSCGMGYIIIPIWSQFRLWKSYKACMAEETLEWEYDSAMTLKDERGWRAAAYIGAGILLVCVYVLAFRVSALPENRGDLTVEEFAENYNRLSEFYGYESGYSLDGEGKWIQQDNLIYDIMAGRNAQPKFLYSQTDGAMTGMRFSVYQESPDMIYYGYQKEMVMAVMAFCGAQEGNSIFSRELEKAVAAVTEASGKSFELSVFGVRVSCEVAYSGYMEVPGSGILVPLEGQEGWYRITFSMSKETEG